MRKGKQREIKQLLACTMHFQLFFVFPVTHLRTLSLVRVPLRVGPVRARELVNKKARKGASYLGPKDSTQLQVLTVEESEKGPFGDGAPWNVKGRQGPRTTRASE